MSPRTSRRRRAAVLVVLLLAASLFASSRALPDGRTVTAYFSAGTALYPGNPVEVLGVTVGTVESVSPEPRRVKAVMRIDDGVRFPAEVHALQVAPSLISGRSVALTPAYAGGPELSADAVIPLDRTEVPLDVNDLVRNVNSLAEALGPDGAGKDGALQRYVDVWAANLEGNGPLIAKTIHDVGSLTTTLAGSREDLTGTITGLQGFVSTLADHDGEVRELNDRLALVTGTLAADRDELGAALRELSHTVGIVADFVRDNRALLRTNVDRLRKISELLVEQRATLGRVLDEGPTALDNLFGAYNGADGTLNVRAIEAETLDGPGALLCLLVSRTTNTSLPPTLLEACRQLSDASATGEAPTIEDLVGLLQGDATTRRAR